MSHTTSDLPAPPPTDQSRTWARYIFLGFAAALSFLLYLDRICISVSAKNIREELGLDDVQVGFMFTAFTLGYLFFEVPSGPWGDRYGPKRVLVRIVLWWSLFTVLTGCIWNFTALNSGYRLYAPAWGIEIPLLFNGFMALLLIRFLFGAGEAGAYPCLAKASSRWFPSTERGFAQGIIATAGRLGGGFSSGLTIQVMFLANLYLASTAWAGAGWRVTFWVFGAVGVVWALAFAAWFRNSPAEHPSVNAAELAYITSVPADRPAAPDPHAADQGHGGIPWYDLLTSVNLLAYSAMAFCSAFVIYLYFTRFPEYLRDRHHVPEAWLWVAGLPMIAGAVGCTLGGLLTDYLVRRTGSRRWGRRIMGMVGKGGGAIFLLTGASMNDAGLAIAFIALSAFSSDLALAAHWAVATDIGGRYVGTVFGVMNMVAAIGGSLSPVLTGYLLRHLSPRDAQGAFDAAARQTAWNVALYVFAATLAVGALCWLRIDASEPIVKERAE